MNTKNTILMLGAGLMQIPAIETAQCMGYTVIACDANDSALGRYHADTFWHIDLRDYEAIISRVRRNSVDAIMTAATDFSYAVSYIAQACRLLSLPISVAQNASFKDTMRQCFDVSQVASPAYKVIENASSCTDIKDIIRMEKQLSFPVVVKPVDNMGARGVRVVHNVQEMICSIREAALYSSLNCVIVEQKLNGPELSIDSIVVDEVLYPLATADRHIVFSPYCIEMGHSIPSRLSQDEQRDAQQALHTAACAIGMIHGVCKGDIIFHDGQAYIGECAARLSGGYMSGWTIPYAYGTDYTTVPSYYAIVLAMQGRIPSSDIQKIKENYAPSPRYCVAERALLSLPGVLKAIHMPAKLQQIPYLPCNSTVQAGVRNIIITANKHSQRTLPTNNTHKAGSVIAVADSHTEAQSYALEAVAQVYFEIEPNDMCHEFLYARDDRSIQYAPWYCYPLSCNAVQEYCTQSKDEIMAMVIACAQNMHIRVHIPDTLQASEEIGTWTHSTVRDALSIAENIFSIQYVSEKRQSINMLALTALLRGGWQGLHYTLQLIQKCKNSIPEYIRHIIS